MPAMKAASSGPRWTGRWMPATSSPSQQTRTKPTSPATNRNLVPTRTRVRRIDQRGLLTSKFYGTRAWRARSQPSKMPRDALGADVMAKKQGPDAQLLTIHELAVYLHLDEVTVNKLVAAGKIPAIQLERQWRFKKQAIDEWIEQQLVGDDESFVDVPDGM